MQRINIPEGMLKAAIQGFHVAGSLLGKSPVSDGERLTVALKAALRWLDGELEKMRKMADATKIGDDDYYGRAIDDVRRMFLQPEPEVPDAIKDLLWDSSGLPNNVGLTHHALKIIAIEAYRRGQQSKEDR